MRLTLKRHSDGRLRIYWYGHANLNGREKVYTLAMWRGSPPATGRASDPGNADFEASRKEALDMLRKVVAQERTDADRTASLERIHAARYGESIESVPLTEAADRWLKIPRKRKLSASHIAGMRSLIGRFVAYVNEAAPRVRTLDEVDASTIRNFLAAEDARGITPRTYNVVAGTLRTLYRKCAPFTPAARALAELPTKEDAPAHREPFTAEELQSVFEAAKADALLYPLVVCAATTAMRRGDVARLRWSSVDLKSGFVTVKTAKTGATTEIPIFPALREVLDAAAGARDGSPFVWPEAAKLYESDSDALNRRLNTILEAAGFVAPERVTARPGPALPSLPPEETRKKALAVIKQAPGWTSKRRAAARDIVTRYLDGQGVKHVARDLGISPGGVSGHLNAVEKMAGCAIVRRREPIAPAEVKGYAVAPAEPDRPRLRRASLRGWHSFRTTWTTLALTAGVPMELVRKVSGHTTADVVLKHYFRPGREDFKRTLQAAMPTWGAAAPADRPLLAAGDGKTARDEALAILDATTVRTWKKDAARVRELVARG